METEHRAHKQKCQKELELLENANLKLSTDAKIYAEKYPPEIFDKLQRDNKDLGEKLQDESQKGADSGLQHERENKTLTDKLNQAYETYKTFSDKYYELEANANKLQESKSKLEKDNKLQTSQSQTYQGEIRELERLLLTKIDLKDHETKISKLQDDIQIFSEKCVMLDGEGTTYRDKFNQLEMEYRKILGRLESEGAELQNYRESNASQQEELSSLRIRNQTLAEDLEIVKSRYEEEQKKCNRLKTDLKDAENENYEVKKRASQSENEISNLTRKLGAAENDVDNAKVKVSMMTDDCQKISLLETEIRVYQEKIQSLEDHLNNFKDKCFFLEEEKSRKAGTVEGEMKVLQQRLANYEKEISILKEKNYAFEDEIQSGKDRNYRFQSEGNLNHQKVLSLETELKIYKEKV